MKQAEPPGGPDRPMNSLVEEVLAPIDRDEFQREIAYYRDLTSPRPPDQPSCPPESQSNERHRPRRQFLQQGGVFLYPLGAVFVVGVGVAVERFIYLAREPANRACGTRSPRCCSRATSARR